MSENPIAEQMALVKAVEDWRASLGTDARVYVAWCGDTAKGTGALGVLDRHQVRVIDRWWDKKRSYETRCEGCSCYSDCEVEWPCGEIDAVRAVLAAAGRWPVTD